MDPHRSSYPDEPEQRWFGSQQYPEPEGHARFETPVDEGSHRSREHWGGGRMPPGAPPGMVGPPPQWAGEPRPAIPTEVPQRDSTQHRDHTTTREQKRASRRQAGSVADGIGRIRPAAGALIGIAAVVVALPVLRILGDSVFGPARSASGVISSVLVLLGLPLGGLGLYGLATAARAHDTPALHAWLRPPVAYLTVALVLFVAAGLAAR